MTLSKIGLFQRRIFQILKDDENISRDLEGQYVSIPKDAKYPLLSLNISKINDLSSNERFSYEIEFYIALFSKERNQSKILEIGDYIIRILNPDIESMSDYKIKGLKFQGAKWDRGDLPNLTKISLNYNALIMGE